MTYDLCPCCSCRPCVKQEIPHRRDDRELHAMLARAEAAEEGPSGHGTLARSTMPRNIGRWISRERG